jgi:Cu/Ag efflux pump CusA
MDVYEAVRKSNIDVGGKVLEKNGVEFLSVASASSSRSKIWKKVVIRQEKGTPIQVKHVATVTLGPDFPTRSARQGRRGGRRRCGVDALRREPARRR